MKFNIFSALALFLCPLLGLNLAQAQPTVEEKIDALAAEIDNLKKQAAKQSGHHGVSTSAGQTIIGGYGELHYNDLDGAKEIDFHRFVLFFGHNFNDHIRLRTELELEHALAGEGKEGEVELEQAYVEFDLSKEHRARGGVFLVPVGILNETHEPPTFYGTERNPVEKNIIPSTWWEGGASLSGELAPGLSYDLAVHSGLNTSAADNYAIRDGRQKVSGANGNNLAYTGRLKWTSVPGLELALAYQHQTDITQELDVTAGAANLIETDAVIKLGQFQVRALYAKWELDGSGPESIGADEQSGYYIEPSYRLASKIGVFTRYNSWNNAAGDNGGGASRQVDYGLNYWPHEDVVIKLDYQDHNDDTKDGMNLGIGYQF